MCEHRALSAIHDSNSAHFLERLQSTTATKQLRFSCVFIFEAVLRPYLDWIAITIAINQLTHLIIDKAISRSTSKEQLVGFARNKKNMTPPPLRNILFILLVQCIRHDAFQVPREFSYQSVFHGNLTAKTQCSLFFRAREEQRQQISNSYATPERIKQLEMSQLQLPFVIDANDNSTITVRKMEPQDLNAIVDLRMRDYGMKDGTKLAEHLYQWWWQLVLKSTMRMKLALDASPLEKDYTVFVVTQHTFQQSTSRVIGRIELSWQPVLPHRLPSAVPIPLLLKRIYCQFTGTPMEVWVSNLWIEPSFRRRGLAKLLVAATEGIATQRTGCTSLHLHCDFLYPAAKRLYQSMEFLIVSKENTPLTFDGDIAWEDCIYFIDGIALLHLRKDFSWRGTIESKY